MPTIPNALFAPAVCAVVFATAAPMTALANDDALADQLFQQLDRDRNGTVSSNEFAVTRRIDFSRLDRNRDGFIDRREFVDLRSPRGGKASERARQVRKLRANRFRALDADRDGRVSRSEYARFGRRLFARLDRNGDKRVTRKEARLSLRGTARSSPANALFARLDRDSNGSLSMNEVNQARRSAFKQLDLDRNGSLTPLEFSIRASTGRPAPPPALKSGRSAAVTDPRFRQLDRNRDGLVSLAEYLSDGRARFAAADRNRDGRISRSEFLASAGGS